jgi:O-antigen/teichoic acid export membrane protein
VPALPEKSLTTSTSWLMFAKTLGFAFTIVIPLLLVRQLSQDAFGLYKQVFLVVGTSVSMLPLGFGLSAFYFLPRDENRRRETVFNVVMFTSTVGALAWLVLTLFPGLLVALFGDPAIAPYSRSIGAVIFLWVTGAFLEIVTVANHEVKLATLAIVSMQFTRAAFFVAAALLAGSIGALLAAAIAQGVIQLAVLLLYLNSRFPRFWAAFDRSAFGAQLAYSLPLGAAGLLYTVQTDLHNYFVSHRFDAATFAVYSVGCFQLPLIGILSDSVGSVMIPRVSYLQHHGLSREILLLTARAVRKLAALFFPLYVLLMVMRREFIGGLFTSQYLDSVPIFAVNLTLIPLGILLVDPIIRAYAEHRHFVLRLQLILLTLLPFALWFSLGRFGALGAIAVVVLFNAVNRLCLLAKVVRVLDVRAHDLQLFSDLLKIGVAALAAGAVTLPARAVASGLAPLNSLVVCSTVFSLTYIASVLALKIVTAEERELVVRKAASLVGASRARVINVAS